ncbi:MAG: metalloregulator ArsR/SmtB family transcription factor [Opitutaceae bacterium]|nr:metalloregulator ArsR/SmtB family transcription factor [Opitutaceae bacterium]
MSSLCFPVSAKKYRELNDESRQLVAQRFAVLAEPMRLRLLQILFSGELSVNGLVKLTGGTQTNVSRHLHTLTAAHLLDRRKQGSQVFYRVADPTVRKLCELVCGSLEKQFSEQADAFRAD